MHILHFLHLHCFLSPLLMLLMLEASLPWCCCGAAVVLLDGETRCLGLVGSLAVGGQVWADESSTAPS